MQLVAFDYDRQAAVDYAHQWAYFRNPQFYDFNSIGGDCTNFVSQCVFAGTGVMNYTPNTGWFYINLNYRAPAWTGVTFFTILSPKTKAPALMGARWIFPKYSRAMLFKWQSSANNTITALSSSVWTAHRRWIPSG